jgi:predicted metal-dependent phosphoesterase TrpH
MDDCLPDFETAANIVREAGGMVFLPHIYEYREHSMDILDSILKNYKIDGIECYYRNFEEWQTEFLLNKCKEYDLYVSGGSDYHGIAHPGVELGTGEGKLSVPDDIINDWAKKFI